MARSRKRGSLAYSPRIISLLSFIFSHQTRAVKDIVQRVFNRGKIASTYRWSGDQHDIPTPLELWQHGCHACSNLPFNTVPFDRISQRLSGDDTDFGYFKLIRMYYQHKKRVGIGSAELPHPLEVTILV